MHLPHIVHYLFLKLIEALILPKHHRADAGYSEHALKCSNRFIEIKFRQRVHIDSSLSLVHPELSFDSLQCIPYLSHQGVLEQIPVLALNSYLSILNQKRCKQILIHLNSSVSGIFS